MEDDVENAMYIAEEYEYKDDVTRPLNKHDFQNPSIESNGNNVELQKKKKIALTKEVYSQNNFTLYCFYCDR